MQVTPDQQLDHFHCIHNTTTFYIYTYTHNSIEDEGYKQTNPYYAFICLR
jgi:hypothetical protein